MGVAEYKIGNAIVRIHEGKLTAEERKANIEAAATRYMKEVMRRQRIREKQRREERVQNG